MKIFKDKLNPLLQKKTLTIDPYNYSLEYCMCCKGTGICQLKIRVIRICNCVYRNIFNIAINFLDNLNDKILGYSTFNVDGFATICMSIPEYLLIYQADVDLAAKEVLTKNEYIVFKKFLLDGLPWNKVNKLVNLDRGNFFHSVYRIKIKVAKRLIEKGIFPYSTYLQPLRKIA